VAMSAVLLLGTLTLAGRSTSRFRAIPRFAQYFNEEGALAADLVRERQVVRSRGAGAYRLHYPSTPVPALNVALTVPEATVRLMFSPYPWELAQGASSRDLFKAVDLLMQLAMVALALAALLRRATRGRLRTLAVLFVVLAAGFGLAAANDGIALRHRSKLFWIVCVAAGVDLTWRAARRDARLQAAPVRVPLRYPLPGPPVPPGTAR
ncbi:MAG TPA: hypothetical protein VFQ45_19535, partial [Longimicrobium sp.]|nr:hypothetical protein [Longimicrobium sp.]